MATKKTAKKAVRKATKKTAKKPVTKKRAYVRKAPVKAPAKKTTKRAYKRRQPVEEQTVQESQVNTAQAAEKDPELDLSVPSSDNNESVLQQIEIIDMRGLDNEDRFSVLAMLSHEGYLTSQSDHLTENIEVIMVGMETDALALHHANRLIKAITWEQAKDSSAISRPRVSRETNVAFEIPRRDRPDTIEVDGAIYLRVG